MRGIQLNLIGFILIFGLNQCIPPPFVDITSICFGYKERYLGKSILSLITVFDGYNVTLRCSNCERISENYINCTRGTLVDVTLTLTKESQSYIVPVNASCDLKFNIATVSNISALSGASSLKLSWEVYNTTINTYIIYYTDHTDNNYRIISSTTRVYVLHPLKEKTWYQICIAMIANDFITGQYRCIKQRTDFSVTGPVTDVRTEASEDSVTISWKKPFYSEDNPSGYIVKYIDQIGSCKSIIITMDGIPFGSSCPSCPAGPPIFWDALQSLNITKLRPFTSYNFTISPYHLQKRQQEQSVTVLTKQGKSERVSSLQYFSRDGFLRIEFKAPTTPNGIIRKYKVRLILKNSGMCTISNYLQYDNSNLTETYCNISLSKFIKCSKYLIEVFPINGWSQNNGVGEVYSAIFEYSPDNLLPISNTKAQVISSNVAQISWTHRDIAKDCPNIVFVIEIKNKEQYIKCHYPLLSNEKCSFYDKIKKSASECGMDVVKLKDITKRDLIINIEGKFTAGKEYEINFWKITNNATLRSSINSIKAIDNDCFTDCFAKAYIGIRSEEGCVPWNISYYNGGYPNILNNSCTMYRDSHPWCATRNISKYCNIPKCSSTNPTSGCIRHVYIQSSTSSLYITWITPHYQGSILGYITVLFSKDKECLQSKAQCDGCNNDSLFGEQVRNFYMTCRSRLVVSGVVSMRASFDHLDQNKKYNVYIIPLLSKDYVGSIKNVEMATMLAKPSTPCNITLGERTKTSFYIFWNQTTNLKIHGPTDDFVIIVREWNHLEGINFTTDKTEYQLKNLKMCTQYCVQIYARNIVGQSEFSNKSCVYTLAPRIGNVITNDVSHGYALQKNISWTYNGGGSCPIQYAVRYIYGNLTQELKTDQTNILIGNLTRNRIYFVDVRPEMSLDTENNVKNGEYAKRIKFYNGIEIPPIYQYNEKLNEQRRHLTISWNFDDSEYRSIYEILVVVRNSTGQCVGLKDLRCRSCTNLNISEIYDEITKSRLYNLCRGFGTNEDFFDGNNLNFTVVFEMDSVLKTYSTEIYTIDLLGMHETYNGTSIFQTSNLILKDKYDQYIRFTRQELNIFWSFNTTKDGSLLGFIIQFVDSSNNCMKSVRLIDKYYSDSEYLSPNEKEMKRQGQVSLQCSNHKDIKLTKDSDTFYDTFKVESSLKNFSVNLFEVDFDSTLIFVDNKDTNFKPLVNPSITEILYHIDVSNTSVYYFWRLNSSIEYSFVEYIVRVTVLSGYCLQSVHYVREERDDYSQKGLSQDQLNKWIQLLECHNTTMEPFSEDRRLFGGEINFLKAVDNPIMSIFGLNSSGIHLLY